MIVEQSLPSGVPPIELPRSRSAHDHADADPGTHPPNRPLIGLGVLMIVLTVYVFEYLAG
jgi:hypothetical protein